MPPIAEKTGIHPVQPGTSEHALSPEKVRDDFRWVYGELGGREALLAWSRENEKEFFRMFFQLLPREAPRDPEGEALVEALCELAEAEPPAGVPEGNR
jgi:hypothetical protein